jgi:hypothetical protein
MEGMTILYWGKMAANGAYNGRVKEGRDLETPRGSHFIEPEARGASDARAAGKSGQANLYVYREKNLEEWMSK